MILLDGRSLSVDAVVEVAVNHAQVALSPDALRRIERCRESVMSKIATGDTAYGINTGFGALCTTIIAPGALRDLQQNLVRSHASGVGELFSHEIVRGAMLLRANNLCRGQSGARALLAEMLVSMLNARVTPVVHQKGSLGASGDLAPLAELALVMMGEGRAYLDGDLLPGGEALARAGLRPVTFEAKEGLALLNGTAFMTAMAALACHRAGLLVDALNSAAALSLVAFRGHADAYSEDLIAARPHPGAVSVAGDLRDLLRGAADLPFVPSQKVQDPYSFRCTPQVHGALKDALTHAASVVAVELNSTTDNPLVIDDRVISGGNFHGQPVGVVMDYLTIAVTAASAISERRVNQLLHPFQSGLPAFLAPDPGLNSGFMIAQYTASALVNENRMLSNPASVQSTPVSADQEDHVSMATLAASKALVVIDNAISIAAIELLSGAQALDLRQRAEGWNLEGLQRVWDIYRNVREKTPFVEKDCALTPLIEEVSMIIHNGGLR